MSNLDTYLDFCAAKMSNLDTTLANDLEAYLLKVSNLDTRVLIIAHIMELRANADAATLRRKLYKKHWYLKKHPSEAMETIRLQLELGSSLDEILHPVELE